MKLSILASLALLALVLQAGCAQDAAPLADAAPPAADRSLDLPSPGDSVSDMPPLLDASLETFVPRLGDKNAAGERLVFSDEFESAEIDTLSWTILEGKGLSSGREAYLTSRPENVSIKNGKLVLTAHAESMGNLAFTSGALETRHKRYWMYGRVEARIKLPLGKGCWPAFWMMPQFNLYGQTPPFDWAWPGNGEIDIIEAISQEPTIAHAAVHYVEDDQHASSAGSHELNERLDAAFHVFAIEWDADRIRWFIDDVQYHEFDVSQPYNGRLPFQQPFYLIINLALGAPWAEAPDASAYPQSLLVDWVRVWQL